MDGICQALAGMTSDTAFRAQKTGNDAEDTGNARQNKKYEHGIEISARIDDVVYAVHDDRRPAVHDDAERRKGTHCGQKRP